MTYWLALDPGLRGGACILRTHGKLSVLDAIDLPTREDGANDQIDIPALCRWMAGFRVDRAIIENVAPMPSIPGAGGDRRSMGATSAFRFGFAVGQIRAFVELHDIPMSLVVPRVWKKHFGLQGPDKRKSIECVKRLLPEAAPFVRRLKDHGKAESILLALYASHKVCT